MSRSRKNYLVPDHGKKGRFPRHSRKVEKIFMDEEDELCGTRVSMRKIHNLADCDNDCRGAYGDTRKMRRVLRKQVGRPWDDVQGEFLRDYDSRTFEGYTVREWLDYVVEENVIIQKNGKITDVRGLRNGYFSEDLYVCPIRKTLEVAKQEHKKARYGTPQKVFELDGTLYHQHEGLWYRVKMKNFENGKNWWGWGHDYDNITDVFISDPHGILSSRGRSWMYREKYGFDSKGKAWYCVWKQSANSKEIARLKTKYFEKKAA